jgi:hypothetical protein
VGSLPHFFGLLLGEAAGVNIVHVPYKGGPAMMTDLISGQLASAIQTTSELAPLHKEGKVRILGTSAASGRELPDVPTFAEAGYPKATGSGWYSLWARKGTSPEAIAAVNRAVNHALLDPSCSPNGRSCPCSPTRAPAGAGAVARGRSRQMASRDHQLRLCHRISRTKTHDRTEHRFHPGRRSGLGRPVYGATDFKTPHLDRPPRACASIRPMPTRPSARPHALR